MKKMGKSVLLTGLFAVSVMMASCGRDDEKKYQVYYLNQNQNGIVACERAFVANSNQELAQGLLGLMNEPVKNKAGVVAKPEDVQIENVMVDESTKTAYVYFNSAYALMPPSREVLYRAAVVKTLTQTDEISQVAFYSEGMPITHPDGTVVGVMSGSDFVSDSAGRSQDLKWVELQLYYANAKGDKLVPLTVSVAYGKNVPLERVVVEQLISGTNESGYYKTLPSKLKLLGISVNDGTCYVNLDSTFLNEMVNVSEAIPVYSIVNSLCQLESINKVQILINGDSNKMYRESMPLSKTYTMNDSIVQKNQ